VFFVLTLLCVCFLFSTCATSSTDPISSPRKYLMKDHIGENKSEGIECVRCNCRPSPGGCLCCDAFGAIMLHKDGTPIIPNHDEEQNEKKDHDDRH
ncbi:hypothetical protein LINPERHAP1_LOCUS3234, partial [Linum perenne]